MDVSNITGEEGSQNYGYNNMQGAGGQRFSAELKYRQAHNEGVEDDNEHLETEELVQNFKQDYEDTKKLLEDKLAEAKEMELNHKMTLDQFNAKLEDLNKIIDNMKHIIIEKDISIKKLQKKLDTQAKVSKDELFKRDEAIEELNRTINVLKLQNEENERMFYTQKDSEMYFKEILNEKDMIIEDLSQRIEELSHRLNLAEDNLFTERNKNIANNEFAQSFEVTRSELDRLKYTFEQQYTKLKEKCKNYKSQYTKCKGDADKLKSENIDFFSKIRELETIIDEKNGEIESHKDVISSNKEQMKEFKFIIDQQIKEINCFKQPRIKINKKDNNDKENEIRRPHIEKLLSEAGNPMSYNFDYKGAKLI